jgi:hypothetical protein
VSSLVASIFVGALWMLHLTHFFSSSSFSLTTVGFPFVHGQQNDYGWTLLNKPAAFNPRT